jgi:hypothetical protein
MAPLRGGSARVIGALKSVATRREKRYNDIVERPIEQRHTGKGKPSAIVHVGRPLNNRQRALLDMLPNDGSRVEAPKKRVSMADLAALTAFTGDEFALFTRGGKRLVLRGNDRRVAVGEEMLEMLVQQGYRWSGHTHPGFTRNALAASDGDYEVLGWLKNTRSTIYNSLGMHDEFNL